MLSLKNGTAALAALMLYILAAAAPATPTDVTFGGTHEYRPFHFLNEQGQPDGFDVAVFKKLSEQAGWRAQYKLGDWSDIQQQLAAGHVDVVPMFVSEERRKIYHFSTPILSTSHRLFGRQGEPVHDSIHELSGQSVGAEFEGYGWRALQHADIDAEIIGTASEAGAIRRVADGSIDYALVNSQVGYHTIVTQQHTNVVALSPPLLPVDYAFAVSPQRPELVGDINRGLQLLQQTGMMDDLTRAWLSSSQATGWRQALRQSLWLIIPLLVILGLTGWLLWRRHHQLRVVSQTADSEEKRRRIAEQKAEQVAVYDELTGLPRETFFVKYLEQALAQAKVEHHSLSVAILTLLDLETIQQLAGYRVARGLLKLEAQALNREHQGTVAYLGQGRFGFIFEHSASHQQALSQLQNLVVIAGHAYEVDGTPVEPSVACGVASFPEHGYDTPQLYRVSELAMTAAREQHKPLLSYTTAMEPDPRNLTLMRDLRRAVDDDVLSWAFQPKYSLTESRVMGAEMLVRWEHPRYGWLPPGLFIPLAEKTGLIKQVTRAALRQAIATVHHWGAVDTGWALSVNVSGNDLADPEIVDEIIDRIDGYASQLTLEVTETAVMRDVDAITRNAERLRAAGLRLSLDDYGSGYSSLFYLKQLNFDEIKIDMNFIQNMLNSSRDQKIVQASIHLAHDLDAHVTAEGVEDLEVAKVLRDMGCNTVQGYGIAKPMTQADFIKFSNHNDLRF